MPNSIHFFEDATIDKIIVHLAGQLDNENQVLNWILENKPLPIKKIKITSLQDLPMLISESGENGDLFGGNIADDEEKNKEEAENLILAYLIDFQNIKFSTKDYLQISNFLKDFPSRFYFYSSSGDNLFNAADKKTLKENKINLINLKKVDAEIQNKIATEYRNQINLMINSIDLKIIIENSSGYIDIIEKLDTLALTNQPRKALLDLFPNDIAGESTPLFMLQFDPQNPLKTGEKWYKSVGENEFQLALSLIYGKLEKKTSFDYKTENLIRIWKEKVINLDKNYKNSISGSGLILWKQFIWEYLKGI